MPIDLNRVLKEIKDIERDKASGVTVETKDDSIQHLLGCVPGNHSTSILPIAAICQGQFSRKDTNSTLQQAPKTHHTMGESFTSTSK